MKSRWMKAPQHSLVLEHEQLIILFESGFRNVGKSARICKNFSLFLNDSSGNGQHHGEKSPGHETKPT